MNIAGIESALVQYLRVQLGKCNLAIDAMPDKDRPMLHPIGEIHVVYQGSEYGRVEALGPVIQRRELKFEILVKIRNLSRHEGVYPVLDACRMALTGWKAPDSREGSTLVRDSFVSEDQGVWCYVLTLAVPSYTIEVTTIEDLPLLEQITLADQSPAGVYDGDTVVIPEDET